MLLSFLKQDAPSKNYTQKGIRLWERIAHLPLLQSSL